MNLQRHQGNRNTLKSATTRKKPGVSQSVEWNVVISLKQQTEEPWVMSSQREDAEEALPNPEERTELSKSSTPLQDAIPSAERTEPKMTK